MTKRNLTLALALAASCLIPTSGFAQQSFETLVGDTKVGDVKSTDTIQLPVLTWGGDVATLHANGAVKTEAGSVFANQNLKLEIVSGDDFVGQVKRYMAGETPFLRGTMRMIGLAAELLNRDPRTKPVVFLQLTWSAGDHMVCRPGIKTLNDLKGKKIVVQKGGPHLGLVDDALRAANLRWSDVEIVWADDLSGTPKSPAEMFRKDPTIAACTVISPDMFSLCGDLNGVGNGEGKSVKGSRVLVSTAQMSRSIADVYAVRKDFYDAHKDVVEKFTAGYLKGCEELVKAKAVWEKRAEKPKSRLEARTKIMAVNQYTKAMTLAQNFFGKEILPTLEDDVHGLISDCSFVGLPGNSSFFNDPGNLSGFKTKSESAVKLALTQKYAPKSTTIEKHSLDYKKVAELGKLNAKVETKAIERFVDIDIDELFEANSKDKTENDTILSFVIYFEPNQHEFSAKKYAQGFERAIRAASTFGNAVVAIAGHADLGYWRDQALKRLIQSGKVTKRGPRNNPQYFINGKVLDLENTAQVMKLLDSGALGQQSKAHADGLLKLSQQRARSVRNEIIKFAASRKYRLDNSQIKSVSLGIREPAVANPKNFNESRKNMRVEFRVLKVNTEKIKKSDFDF